MDINELISKVQLNPPIWDKRIKEHANRNIVDACWKQISSEMMTDGITLRKKWKYLRDNFSMEFSKIKTPRSGDAAETSGEPKWPYYKGMLFLKDIVTPRASSSNLKKALAPTDDGEDELFTDSIGADNRETEGNGLGVATANLTEAQPAESNELLPLSLIHLNKRKRAKTNSMHNEKILELEQQKIATIQSALQKNDSEDLMYFKSYLPFVSKIPAEKKLEFRNRFHQVITEFVFGGEHSQQTSPVPFTSNRSSPAMSSSSSYDIRSPSVENYHHMLPTPHRKFPLNQGEPSGRTPFSQLLNVYGSDLEQNNYT